MQIFQITHAIFGSLTNIVALIVIVSLTMLALFGRKIWPNSEKLKHYIKQSPSILATVGIFFSFWGISIGLISLDLNDIQNSIPKLLDGLKVKFIASLMGIFASIVVRVTQSFTVEQKAIEISSDEKIIKLLSAINETLSINTKNSPEALLQELKQTIEELPTEFKKQNALLNQIRIGLAGEGDSSITTQLGKLRSDMRDSLKDMDNSNKQRAETLNNTLASNFDHLSQKFEDFARIVAENNSKAFIEALEKAMRDFNNNITEQFGENFKELNRAVGELLKWQDNYKNYVEQLTSNFELALVGITSIQSAFNDIQTRSQSFTEVSTELSGILQKLDIQLQDLNHYLKALGQVADSAKKAFPIIEDNLIKLTTGFKKSTEQSLADINSTVESVGENLIETTGRLKETTGKLRDSMENQKETLETTSQEFKDVVSGTLKSLAKETKTSIENYQESLQEVVTEQLGSINTNIKQSNALVNTTIQNASVAFEASVNYAGDVLRTATDTVAAHLTGATNSMEDMMEIQQETLVANSGEFKAVVNQTLSDLSQEAQTSMKLYQESLQKTVTTQLDSINFNIKQSNTVVNTTIQNASAEFEKTIKTQSESMNKTIKEYERSLHELVSNQSATVNSSIISASKEFNRLLTENTNKSTSVLEQQTQLLDKALQEELKRALETMGKHLASLSNQFVQDYRPLTERLRDVVNIAEDLKRRGH